MKKLFLFAVIALTVMSATAQLKVYNDGNVRVGRDNLEEHNMGYIENYMDTITSLRVWGNQGMGIGARMSFGYQKYLTKNVMLGERYMDEDDVDSDVLWLHGKKGFCFTYNGAAGDTIINFDPLPGDDIVKVNKSVQAPSFLVTSDARLKEEIEPLENSLDALSSLSGVSYRLKPRKTPDYAIDPETERLLEMDGRKSDNDLFAQYYAKVAQGKRQYGFIAQELKEVLPNLVYTDKNGYMSVDYIGLIPILVNAVNELSAELAELKAEKQDEETPSTSNSAPTDNGIEGSALLGERVAEVLSQNDPNPFSSDTRIGYNLPDGTQQATIYIYDLQGKQVKRLNVDARDNGVTLQGGDLQAGMYIYSLI
ncbi:MAG: tail fiber domain-containing protein, partial [Muribaculaceae bacterium]|nr:tail fiber domain-containing protein [Muribaculaceae bacterium]